MGSILEVGSEQLRKWNINKKKKCLTVQNILTVSHFYCIVQEEIEMTNGHKLNMRKEAKKDMMV